MYRDRVREIFKDHPLAQVELLLAAESIALLIWLISTGGDCTFRILRSEMATFIPMFSSGRVVMSVLLVVNMFRVVSVIAEWLHARLWLARLSCFGWCATLLTYLILQVSANELPIFLVGCLANFWVAVRLDERNIRQRNSGEYARRGVGHS